ncbi:hypothetical protein PTKIN_Ptkin14bG0183200 [Pterospermum kingtungense]
MLKRPFEVVGEPALPLPTPILMGKTGFLLPLLVVVLLPAQGLTLSADSPNNITTDQLALLSLKSHVTNDARNLLATNWSTTTSVCNWIGVTCGSRLHRVTALNLSYMGLTGTIEPHLGNLSFLAWLDISHNNFHGSLPIELANMRQLKHLRFGSNSFSGEIPSWFGSLTKLKALSLHDNKLTGVIPSTLWNLSKLEELDLSNNHLEGTLSLEIRNLISLEFFFLNGNLYIGGEIPWVISNMTSLKHIDFSDNSFTGRIPIPPPSAHWFSVSMNNLVGEIPSSVCNWSSLQGLNLAENNLGGTIPDCFGNLSSSLSHIDVKKNKLHGPIPENFAKGCSLTSFYFSNNQLEGSLPRSLGNCKDLILLDVGNNNLNDTFPIWLGHMDQLQILLLRSNRFHGNVDKYFDEVTAPLFPRLRVIDLSHNEFSGYLPTNFFKNLYLIKEEFEKKDEPEYVIDASIDGYVYYIGKVSFTIKGLETDVPQRTTWTGIDFSGNQFFGEIPEALGELQPLLFLNLSHNSLTGSIPSSLSDLTELESLDLSWNRLEGRIPAQLKNLTFLAVLNLSHNYLVGPIPQGRQFDTFTNDSYIGNLGLCGLPLSTSCSNNEELKPTLTNEIFTEEFSWKTAMLMGYGCGVVLGMSMGYIVFTIKKPWWFVRLIERSEQKYVQGKLQRSKGEL